MNQKSEAFSQPKQRLISGWLTNLVGLRWGPPLALVCAGLVIIVAPVLALYWSAQPFPGFVVEQTLVVAGIEAGDWTSREVSLDYPHQVIYLDYHSIHSWREYAEVLSSYSKGQWVQVRTRYPDGAMHVFPPIRISDFPTADLLRLFWLPYVIGLAYLAMGWWVYHLRGTTRPGRAFAFFSACAAIVNALIFDLSTTHLGSALWTVAMALIGGALVSLALLFPEEWRPITRRVWLRLLPYLPSLVLAIWGLAVLYDVDHPWAYVLAWRSSYFYAAIGILAFVAMTIHRLRVSTSLVARQQARLIMLGTVIAFAPVSAWFLAPQLGISIHWNPVLFLPLLLVFPIAIMLAILRYRLWDVDVIINRTLVYALLTLILIFIYWASIMTFQLLFTTFFANITQLAAAISTLLIAALFNPLRGYVQNFIDQRFYRRKYDAAQTLIAFGVTVRDEVDLNHLIERLENIIWETTRPAYTLAWLSSPTGYQVYLSQENRLPTGYAQLLKSEVVFSCDDPLVQHFRNAAGSVQLDQVDLDSRSLEMMQTTGLRLVLPLVSQGELVGWLGLGPRLSEQDYSLDDRALLTQLAVQAAPAVRVAQMVQQQQAESIRRDRLEYELGLARRIQYSLLPEALPRVTGWHLATHYEPASAVGGDFFDFIHLADGRLGLVIGDVADKGIPAALVMAVTRGLLRAVAQETSAPGEVLARVNNMLEPDIPTGMFVTCLYGVLDPESGLIRYANAGHNPPFRRQDGRASELKAKGMPLGLMPDMEYEEKETTILTGEYLVLYSDGLVEAHAPDGDMYGYQRLRTRLSEPQDNSSALIEQLLAELAAFTGPDWQQEDDITIVTLQRMSQVPQMAVIQPEEAYS